MIINKIMKLDSIKIYTAVFLTLIISYSCNKEEVETGSDSYISFELEGEQMIFNNGYFWGGNYFEDDTRCPYPKCLYESSYIQHESNNGSDIFFLSLNDSILGTYTFNSINNQLNTFRVVLNGDEYVAYSYTAGSDDFIVEITEFGTIGGRIKGTFSGTAVLVIDSDFKDETLVTNGEFDIKREEI